MLLSLSELLSSLFVDSFIKYSMSYSGTGLMLDHQHSVRLCLSLGSQSLEKEMRHHTISAKDCDSRAEGSTALPQLRTLQQAVMDEQELEKKVEGGKRVGDGVERDSCMKEEKIVCSGENQTAHYCWIREFEAKNKGDGADTQLRSFGFIPMATQSLKRSDVRFRKLALPAK